MTGAHRPADPAEQQAAAAGGEIPTIVIVFVGFLTVVLIAAVTILTIYDKPVDNVLVIVGAFIAPTVASLLAIRKLDKVAKGSQSQVDHLITDKAILENQVAALGDVPATLPTRRATDTMPRAFPKIGFEGKDDGR